MLGSSEREQVDRHVHGKDLATTCGGGLLVEPALDHGIEAHQRNAGDDAQQHPEQGMDDEGVQQHAHGHRRAEEGEGAYMAHAPDQAWRNEGAEKVAEEIGGADQAERGVGKTFQTATQCDDGIEQAGAEQQKSYTGKERAGRE